MEARNVLENTHIQIKAVFEEVKDLLELKKEFKRLAKIYHPDVGGSNEAFKILNSLYNTYLEDKIYFSNDTKINIELEKIISTLLIFENINIEVVGSWIWVSGETQVIKEHLKDNGFKWASKKKMWYFGEMKKRSRGQRMEDIRAKYGSQTIKREQSKKIEINK
jgi:hypothetical protein